MQAGSWNLESREGSIDSIPKTERSMPMKKFVQSIITALMIVLMVGLSGCRKEGPFEKAGKKIDNTI